MPEPNRQYIKSVHVTLFGGIFQDTVELSGGLNIITGTNGTGKTRFLEMVKRGEGLELAKPNEHPRILAFSPKRNAVKRDITTIANEIRTNNRRMDARIQEAFNRAIEDNTYSEITPFSEFFILKYLENSNSPDILPRDAMNDTVDEFNRVLGQIFPNYKISAEWDVNTSSPRPKLYKDELEASIEIHEVSTGEQEILSLVFNIVNAAGATDVFLIDEPEIHLNWTLERSLFDFFRKFCRQYSKQVVVTTHSRIVMFEEFIKDVQYFNWENKKIHARKQVPPEVIRSIAGEAVRFLRSSSPEDGTLLVVEDNAQKYFVQALLELYRKDSESIEILTIAEGKGAIEKLYDVVRTNDGLNSRMIDAYFMVDSDNSDKIFADKYFIKLSRYSIESYLFADLPTLAKVLNIELSNLKLLVKTAIKSTPLPNMKYKKAMELLIQSLELKDTIFRSQFFDLMDCKEIAKGLDANKQPVINSYVQKLGKTKAGKIFDKKLIDLVKGLPSKSASDE